MGHIIYRFRDIDAFSSIKLTSISHPPLFDATCRKNALRYQRNLYTDDKSGLQSFADNLFSVVGCQICEIPREFELIPVQGHPR